MDSKPSIILIAYVLDLIFGDPPWAWHPTRLMGRSIETLERRLNAGGVNKRFTGTLLVILAAGGAGFCVWAALKSAFLLHPVFHYCASVLFIYFSLSVKSLVIETNKVYDALRDADLEEARRNLSMIVARDTKGLDQPEIIRAAIETTAEGVMDGIVAPLFYAFLGGPVLAWVYKAINTLDSMVGYKNERFMEFGWASAKLDGIVNFIPARITCLLIGISSWIYGKDGLSSFMRTTEHIFKGPEFNGQAAEAAMAGALGVRLGGVNFYDSAAVFKPFIGAEFYPLGIGHIKEGIKIAYLASGLCLIFGTGLILLFKYACHFIAVQLTSF